MLAFLTDKNGNADIAVVPATGGEPRILTTSTADDFAFVWSPDGRTIVYVSEQGDGKLVTVSVAELLGGN